MSCPVVSKDKGIPPENECQHCKEAGQNNVDPNKTPNDSLSILDVALVWEPVEDVMEKTVLKEG